MLGSSPDKNVFCCTETKDERTLASWQNLLISAQRLHDLRSQTRKMSRIRVPVKMFVACSSLKQSSISQKTHTEQIDAVRKPRRGQSVQRTVKLQLGNFKLNKGCTKYAHCVRITEIILQFADTVDNLWLQSRQWTADERPQLELHSIDVRGKPRAQSYFCSTFN